MARVRAGAVGARRARQTPSWRSRRRTRRHDPEGWFDAYQPSRAAVLARRSVAVDGVGLAQGCRLAARRQSPRSQHRDEQGGHRGEYKVRGRAIAETDRAVQHGYARAIHAEAGWEPEPGRFHLFRVDVHDVTFIRWDPATNDQFVTRWPRRREFVRRGTSATSVGDPEPFSELLAEGSASE